MSHNLTDRELNDLIAAAVAVTERMSPEERAAMMEAQRQSWARGEAGLRETSASPPRVPGASAQCTRAGVESGPGQPMDICERLDADAASRDNHPATWSKDTAALEREAAAEIRRLLKKAVNARPEGYRAGIEAAADHVSRCANSAKANSEEDLADDLFQIERAIRALADAPEEVK